MNIKDELENLLPDELENIKLFVDNLFNNKINERLTNQSYQKKDLIIKCPKCNMSNYKRNGHKNGTQRYLCKNCNKSFSITTNTILNYTKIKYWQLYKLIKCLLDAKPVAEISEEIQMSKTEVYYLEIKIFKALEKTFNDIKLRGVVQVDEKYFRINFKGTKHDKMPRKTKHSGSQDLKIGINNELSCVIVAIDEYDSIIVKVVGNGNVTTKYIENALSGKIEENSIIITDSKSSYIKFARDNNLMLKQIPDGKHSVEDKYNLNNVNELILELENYINRVKRGVSTRHLQQYCNFIKYKKILKYTVEYLNRNQKLYKDSVILFSNLTNKEICQMELPFDISAIFDD